MGMFADIGTNVGAAIGASKAKKYSKKAMKAQVAAAEKGIGQVNQGWDYTQGVLQPWMQAGTGALGQYGNLVGLGGADQQQAAIDALRQSPYYQSLYRAGEEAVLQNSSATGGLRGGNTQESLFEMGEDALSRAYQQQLQNLGPGMQYGYGATGQGAQYGTQHSSDVANLYLGQGQAQAADYMRRAAATSAMWQGIGGAVGGVGDAAAAGFGAPGGGFDFGAAMGQGAGTMGGIGSQFAGGGLFGTGAPPGGVGGYSGFNYPTAGLPYGGR
jgi:hypothetical protein